MYQYPNYLMHYGVPGMKWGRRKSRVQTSKNTANGSSENKKQARIQKLKTAAKIGATVAGVSLAAYGGYKAAKYLKSPAGQEAIKKGKEKLDDLEARAFSKVYDAKIKARNRKWEREEIRRYRNEEISWRKAQAKAEKNRKLMAEAYGEEFASKRQIVSRKKLYKDVAKKRADKIHSYLNR